jgi:hypothetical protein
VITTSPATISQIDDEKFGFGAGTRMPPGSSFLVEDHAYMGRTRLASNYGAPREPIVYE